MTAVEHHIITIGEVQIKPTINRVNKAVTLPLLINQDTATDELLAILRSWVNHRFAVVLRRIDDDEQPALQQKRRKATSDSTNEAVGELPAASGGDSTPPDLSAAVESAIETHNKQIALKNLGWAQKLRNNTQFRGWLFDYCRVPIMRNPVEAKEWVRQKQHELMKIDSCSKIYPGSYAESMLKWMSSAFDLDLRNLPMPRMPDEAA